MRMSCAVHGGAWRDHGYRDGYMGLQRIQDYSIFEGCHMCSTLYMAGLNQGVEDADGEIAMGLEDPRKW
jgi:hypothetical protein